MATSCLGGRSSRLSAWFEMWSSCASEIWIPFSKQVNCKFTTLTITFLSFMKWLHVSYNASGLSGCTPIILHFISEDAYYILSVSRYSIAKLRTKRLTQALEARRKQMIEVFWTREEIWINLSGPDRSMGAGLCGVRSYHRL